MNTELLPFSNKASFWAFFHEPDNLRRYPTGFTFTMNYDTLLDYNAKMHGLGVLRPAVPHTFPIEEGVFFQYTGMANGQSLALLIQFDSSLDKEWIEVNYD